MAWFISRGSKMTDSNAPWERELITKLAGMPARDWSDFSPNTASDEELKEIGTSLCLSVATVKHHVHHILEKLKLTRRAQAMRKVRDAPWIARTTVGGRKA